MTSTIAKLGRSQQKKWCKF